MSKIGSLLTHYPKTWEFQDVTKVAVRPMVMEDRGWCAVARLF
jgi:hypothetical protein